AAELRRMTSLDLLDLDTRKGKAPGGYNMELSEIRLPFVFMNAVGRDGDVWTLLHESGHAFHVFAMRDKGFPYQYRSENVPLEIAEVASQAMEIIGGEHLEGTFYSKEDAVRSKREHLASIVKLLAWIATIDAFPLVLSIFPSVIRVGVDPMLEVVVRCDACKPIDDRC